MVSFKKGHYKPETQPPPIWRQTSITSTTFVILYLCWLGFNVLVPTGLLQLHIDSVSVQIKDAEQESQLSQPIPGISLVTSFFAVEKNEESRTSERSQHAHRRELEAALLVNLQNPFFRQVVVVLDSVTDKTINCQGFVDYTTMRLIDISKTAPLVFASSTNKEHNIWHGRRAFAWPHLECIEVRENPSGASQPTYLDMLRYATYHPIITSDKVILSNPDQVFDDTLSNAELITNKTIFVLSTQGYSMDSPDSIRAQYHALLGDEKGRETKNWCQPSTGPDGCSDSWDAYIFHRSLLKETIPLSPTDHHGGSPFTRLNFWRKPSAYYMNEIGAEYAALYDIVQGLQGKVTVWNACQAGDGQQ
jgi:hypothetical protein